MDYIHGVPIWVHPGQVNIQQPAHIGLRQDTPPKIPVLRATPHQLLLLPCRIPSVTLLPGRIWLFLLIQHCPFHFGQYRSFLTLLNLPYTTWFREKINGFFYPPHSFHAQASHAAHPSCIFTGLPHSGHASLFPCVCPPFLEMPSPLPVEIPWPFGFSLGQRLI